MGFDFSQRAELDEDMDSVASFAEYRRCLHDLNQVSGMVLAHRPALEFLNVLVKRVGMRGGQALHILDVACGDGNMLRRIAVWARRRGVEVRLTGVDLNPRAIEVAREFEQAGAGVEYVASDVFCYRPEVPVDVVLSAHFTHHLGEDALVRFLRWMEETAGLGWFVNDLHRSANPYRMFGVLGRVMRWHPVVVSDGLISIRRAFRVEDWERMLGAAGVEGADVEERFPARLTVGRIKGVVG